MLLEQGVASKRTAVSTLLLVTAALLSSIPTMAQNTAPPATGNGGIAWYGMWENALSEAKRTGKPILLVSGAPHCRGISGIW